MVLDLDSAEDCVGWTDPTKHFMTWKNTLLTDSKENTESPATAFRMFAHRAWTRQDFQIWRRWRTESVWEDLSVVGDSIATEHDDTTGSVVVPADANVGPGGGGGSRGL
jgi:hypothetical protein